MSGTPGTSLRAPIAQVLAGGAPLPGLLSVAVKTNNHAAAGTFSAAFALGAQPLGLAAWDALIGTTLTIEAASGGAMSTLLTGTIDRIEADPIGGLATIEGRDLTSVFIEARTRESFDNQTASDIATLLAGRHGLGASVTATTTPIGRYYSNYRQRSTLDRYAQASTEWDLLVWLARQEGFAVSVRGTTLFFNPPPPPTPVFTVQAAAANLEPPNVTALRCQHATALAGTLQVTVKSWNSQMQAAISETAVRAGTGPTRSFIFMRPNLSAEAALAIAQQKLARIAVQEYVIDADLPGELALAPGQAITLAGTQSSFDQVYVIDHIERRLDLRHGFTETLRAILPPPAP